MVFGENEDGLDEMMDLSDLPTSLFACSVHEAVFEVQEQKVGTHPVPALTLWEAKIALAPEPVTLYTQCVSRWPLSVP